jgi:hypothetical protein
MKANAKWLVLVLLAATPAIPGYSQGTATPPAQTPGVPANLPPSTAEVVKMAQSGVGDDVVIAYIKNSQSLFNLSANDVLALKNAGLSSPVMTAMLTHDNAVRSQRQASQPQQPAAPPQPTAVQSAPAPAPAPPAPTTAPPPAIPDAPSVPMAPSLTANAQPVPPGAARPPRTVIVEQAPPAAQVEVVPLAPSPEYYWVPGYWSWRGGAWVWVGGCWVHRPVPSAVWVGGHWARHGRGYIWIGGRWR